MSLPDMNVLWTPNWAWLEWQAKKGQDRSYWWTNIFDSENFWTNINIDIGQFAFNIAHAAATREGLQENKEIVDDIFVYAKLGVLAGMFEKASQATAISNCHPLIWNAMISFNLDSDVVNMAGRPKIPKSSPLLRESTTWAGYALGKIPTISVEQVFDKWRK